MSNRVTVFQTTGAVSVGVDDEFVYIDQASLHGDRDDGIAVPRPLFKEVLNQIFSDLHPWELAEIIELAEVHRTPSKEG